MARPATQARMLLASPAATPVILLAPDASEPEKFASRELATYLGKILGREVPTKATGTPAGKGTWIVLGHHPLNSDLHPEKMGVEDSVVEVGRNVVRIVGGREPSVKGSDGSIYTRDRGTLYGVYELLESLGVRWYRPEAWGEFVPKLSRIELPLGRRLTKPVYTYRSGPHSYLWWRDETMEQRRMTVLWATRNRQNTNMYSPPEYGGYHLHDFGHAYYRLVPVAEYYEKHPEYFALINGKRSNDRNAQLNLGNLEVQDIVAQKIIANAKSEPQQDVFSLEPNDFALWGQEPESVAMDDPALKTSGGPHISMTNRVATFNNIVAKRLAEAVPGKKVGWYAYNWHTEAPTKVTRMEPNTLVMVAAYARYYSDYSKSLHDPKSAANARFLKALEGWGKLTTIMTHEYFSGYNWHGPLPVIATMTDRLREYRKYNVVGVDCEANPSWGPQGLALYMYTRLTWNPDIDVARELDLYYKNYYGPAAAPMKAYHEIIENAATGPAWWGSGGEGLGQVFTGALIARLKPQMEKARELAKGRAPYEQRLEGVWAGYEYARRLREFLDLRDQDKVPEALKAMDDLKAFILSYKEGDVFENTPTMFPAIFRGVTDEAQDLVERGRLTGDFENPVISLKLDKGWRFKTDARNAGLAGGWFESGLDDRDWAVLNADQWWQDQGYPDYHGVAWYRKSFAAPARRDDQRIVLFFGAVDGDASVYINGRKIGEHLLDKNNDNAGYDKPFYFDITDALAVGQSNQITVRVSKDIFKAGIWKGVQLLKTGKIIAAPGP